MQDWSARGARKERERAWLRSPAADALDGRVTARALELLKCGPELASDVALSLCRSTAAEPEWFNGGDLTDAELDLEIINVAWAVHVLCSGDTLPDETSCEEAERWMHQALRIIEAWRAIRGAAFDPKAIVGMEPHEDPRDWRRRMLAGARP